MEVTAKALREVEFREKMRGYHPEDVDQFLEQVAAGVEALHERLRQAVERAQRAEAAAAEAGGNDETLRRTLVLAQRTADMAVQEAREQAARILAGAEQQAQAILAEAEQRAKQTLEDGLAETKAELSSLEALRANAEQEVEGLQRWLAEHKSHLQAALADALAAVERADLLWPAPSSRPIEIPGAGAPGGAPEPAETRIWSENGEREAATVDLRSSTPPDQDPFDAMEGTEEEEEHAMDSFFRDSEELQGDRRFGSRLRRRR